MRLLILAILTISAPAGACPEKSNELAIVLGLAGEPVILRLALHEGGELHSHWSGTATLAHGTRTIWSTSIAQAPNIDGALAQVVAGARVEARKLGGFVPAVRAKTTDCTARPGARCERVVIGRAGTELRVGATSHRIQLALPNLAPEGLGVTGVVRYRAGARELVVVNLGAGDPKFATTVRLCDGSDCRTVTTLHHAEQADVVVDAS